MKSVFICYRGEVRKKHLKTGGKVQREKIFGRSRIETSRQEYFLYLGETGGPGPFEVEKRDSVSFLLLCTRLNGTFPSVWRTKKQIGTPTCQSDKPIFVSKS